MKQIILFLYIVFTATFTIFAQPDCNNNLDLAKKMYNQGRFDEAVTLINTCSEIQTNQVSKWQGLHLLSQCYLGLNDFKKAKAAAEDMLEKNPLYKPSIIDDTKEFVNLLKGVRVVPRFSIGLSTAAGININYPNVMNSYGITTDKKTYKNGKARQFGVFAGYGFSEKLSLNTGVMYIENNYSLNYKVQKFTFSYSETMNYLQIPLFARYQILSKGKFKAFAQAGIYTGFLTKSKYNMERTSPDEFDNTKLKSIDITENRAKTVLGALTGLGVSYKWREGHVFADINYQYSFSNINKSENRLSNENLIYNYYYIDDDLRLNNLTLSLGYTFYLNYFVQRSK
mgnify:CR=1 FL=1